MNQQIHQELEHIIKEIETDIDKVGKKHINCPMQKVTNFSYKENSLETYIPTISLLQEKIDTYTNQINKIHKKLKEIIQENESAPTYKAIHNSIKKKTIRGIDKEYEDFWKVNQELKKHVQQAAPKECTLEETLKETKEGEEIQIPSNPLVEVYEQIQGYKKTTQEAIPLKKEIEQNKSKLLSLSKELQDINKKIKFFESIKNESLLSHEEITELFIDTLYEDCSLNSAVKIIKRKKEEFKQQQREKIIKSKEKIEKKIEIKNPKPTTTAYKKNSINKEDIEFVKKYKISNKRAKNIVKKKNFEYVKEFMHELNQQFLEYGFSQQETNSQLMSLFANNHILTGMQKKFGKEYLQAINDLFSTYEDKNKLPSGILPSFCKEKYKNAQTIRTLISKEKNKIDITGLELILKKKHAKLLIDELTNDHPYNTGRHVAKSSTVSSINGVSHLYDACVKEIGHEGHFRRKGFGHNARVLFEVGKKHQKYEINVFKYFTDHSEYNKFFQR
ncbi:MAG: hypothetical protein ACLFNM_02780 [Candidatus Woesearchaeota archaeon]